jgi:glucose-1-phosphate cytidylyltransferase
VKVVILAGGYGTRLSEETDVRPKPMIEVGGYPILWHIMKGYASFGYTDFVIALGYKGNVIKRYFYDYNNLSGDVTLDFRKGEFRVVSHQKEDWVVRLIDTGTETLTGGRLKRLEPLLSDGQFMLTYGDGVSNINVRDLVEFHNTQGKKATVTAVRPPARFGGLVFQNNIISEFTEKPQIGEGWINGGFMVFEPDVFSDLNSDTDVLEVDLLEKIAKRGELAGYRHEDFWQCMDTLRDKALLEKLWDSGEAPWRIWS